MNGKINLKIKYVLIISAILIVMLAITLYLTMSTSHRDSRTQGTAQPPDAIVASPEAKRVDYPRTQVIAENLVIPWDIAFLPNGEMLVTERSGNLVHIDAGGKSNSVSMPRTVPRGEGGLLGIALHPEFSKNRRLYLYMTTESDKGATQNAVFSYILITGDQFSLIDEKTVISGIPGAIYHDGGRIEFGPDGYLYITTGDATSPKIAQDKNSLGGKILRLGEDGAIPADNPFSNAIYSYGHRNPQGITWDSVGRLWSTEHGRSGVLSGYDELNLITKGSNYGWPTIQGDETRSGMNAPVLQSGASDTWAPASAAYLDGRIYFGGLRGESLYEAVLDGTNVKELRRHFHEEFGRIRTVRVGSDGMLYLTTSNRDGRGTPGAGDDRIIRINPSKL